MRRTGTERHSQVFQGSRANWRFYVLFTSASALVLAEPIFAPARGGVVLQVISVGFTSGAAWQAWRGLRGGTVEVTGNEARVFGLLRTRRFELGGVTHFEARLMPLRFLAEPHVVLVAHDPHHGQVVMRSINSGVRRVEQGQTWVDVMVRRLNDWAE